MRLAPKLSLFAATLAALLAASPAAAEHMTDFDLNRLDNWSDALAVCDITRFLLTDPDTSADVILVAGRDNTRVTLYKPLFLPPTNFFSDVMRQAFDNLQRTSFVTRESYGRARLHFARRMIAAFSGATLSDKRFMAEQMELCYHLAARAGVRLTPTMRATP